MFKGKIAEKVDYLEARVQQVAELKAAQMLSSQITLEMIQAAASADRFRYKGVPVTEVQFNALMKAEGFDTGRF